MPSFVYEAKKWVETSEYCGRGLVAGAGVDARSRSVAFPIARCSRLQKIGIRSCLVARLFL